MYIYIWLFWLHSSLRQWQAFYKNDENDFERAPFMEVERGRDWEIVAPVHKLLLHLTTLSILNSENFYSAWKIECGCGFKRTKIDTFCLILEEYVDIPNTWEQKIVLRQAQPFKKHDKVQHRHCL